MFEELAINLQIMSASENFFKDAPIGTELIKKSKRSEATYFKCTVHFVK